MLNVEKLSFEMMEHLTNEIKLFILKKFGETLFSLKIAMGCSLSLKFEECLMIFYHNFTIKILTHFLALFIYVFIGMYEESMIYLKLAAQMFEERKPFESAKYQKSERVISAFVYVITVSFAFNCSLQDFENAESFFNQVLEISRKDKSGKNNIVHNQKTQAYLTR